MPTIIRDRDAVKGAAMEDLNHTYRQLKGEPGFKGFSNRAAAEVQVNMAIMAAQDAVGRAGVPKGVTPGALTPGEIKSKNPYKEGTLSHQLHKAVSEQKPIEPRPKASEQPKEKRAKRLTINKVRATNAGESRPQAGSIRNQVLQYVQNAPEQMCTVAELEEHFQQNVRGYLQKLVEKNHLTIIEDEE
jgi:hypothetical protein